MARWERSKSETAADYGIFRVHRHQILRDGAPMRAVHTIETQDWVTVIPVTADDEVLFVRLHRFGIDAQSLETPGGLVDPGEDPAHAARRELIEETGYDAGELVHLRTIHPNPALQSTRVHFFLATGCTKHPGGQALEDLEDCEVVRVPRAELDSVFERGEITHAVVWGSFKAWELHERALASRTPLAQGP